MNYGAVNVSMKVLQDPSITNVYFHDATESGEPHAMAIIGWDDNYSKNNFTSPNGYTPKKKMAHIYY